MKRNGPIQRKTQMAPSMIARAYLTEVKNLPCVLCTRLGQRQSSLTEAHHVRAGQGMSQRASDFLTAALCAECHRGTLGVHGDRTLMKLAKAQELDLAADTIELIFLQYQS